MASSSADAEATARTNASPLQLLGATLGSPRQFAGKFARAVRLVAAYADTAELSRRLKRLQSLGVIEQIPAHPQLFCGSADMLRFWIVPAARDYYGERGIDFRFHQVLRFLDEPASLLDPIGLLSTRDNIIGHLLQVVHANPRYDFELLSMFDDGLDELERQGRAVIDGTHPRAAALWAIVEEAGYYERLLGYLAAFRQDPDSPELRRSNVEAKPAFAELDRTFGAMGPAFRYFCSLPSTWPAALAHPRKVRGFHPL